MVRLRHRWLGRHERIRWRVAAHRAAVDTRPVGGRLFITDRRLVFEPFLPKRFADARLWDAPIEDVRLSIGPGSWTPRFKLLEPIALRYQVSLYLSNAREERFFLRHVGMLLEQLASAQIPVAARSPDVTPMGG